MRPITDTRVLVTGCPRSGTRYVRQLLARAGLDIGHERVKVNGAVCSFLAVDDDDYGPNVMLRLEGQRRRDFDFDHVWHVVRHPLRVIESLETAMRREWWTWQSKHTGILPDTPYMGARFWLVWNERIEADPEVGMRFRVEDVPWAEMCRRLGIEAEMPDVSPGASSLRGVKRLRRSWADLGPYEEPIRKKAAEYGYDA